MLHLIEISTHGISRRIKSPFFYPRVPEAAAASGSGYVANLSQQIEIAERLRYVAGS